ncbi:hypothetical protein [Jiangella alba]|uniref:Uncharacterized protein n=1 Tax=Jiangella alba TaxID=561176 RepID=A0A1H5J9J0_9ACTN|nr:hypothetical protein [Jiangella alba]SEE48278.1 hypothetical protein SAMN04488561_1466 [Jiangella alba]
MNDITVNEMAAEVAAELSALTGVTWSVELDRHGWSSPDCAWLLAPDDQELSIRANGHRLTGRAVIRGVLPDGAREVARVDSRGITVTLGRGARAIAREIHRRLLPTYLPSLAEVREALRRWDEARDRAHAVLAELAPLLGLTHERHDRHDRAFVTLHGDGFHGFVEVGHSGTPVKLEFTGLSVEIARAMLTALGSRWKAPRDGDHR